MPLRYRKEIAPFHKWVAAGFERYAKHPATVAGVKLANELLNFSPAHEYSYLLQTQRFLRRLRDADISEQDVLIRVAEFVAFIERNPKRFRNQREEDHALGRAVIHLLPLPKHEKRPLGVALRCLGELVREHCYPWALAFVRRLTANLDEKGTLLRQSSNFDLTER